jgi:hypothetical protein
VRFSIIAGLVILLGLVLSAAGGGRAQAGRESGVLLQDTPGYNVPTDDGSSTGNGNGYIAPATDTPFVYPTQEFATPSLVFTVTNTATQPPNVFRTEDYEMNQSKTTPVVTETPGPTATKVVTTIIKTPQSSPTPTLAAVKGSAFTLDWGMFLTGLALPILAACGYILYLLDRKPELFKRTRR